MSEPIRLFKLTSGDEIIGRQTDTDSEFYTLKSVRLIIMQPTGPGQIGLGMIPWMGGAPDEEIRVSKKNIMGWPVGGVPKQLEDNYLQQTSGLQLATALDLAKK